MNPSLTQGHRRTTRPRRSLLRTEAPLERRDWRPPERTARGLCLVSVCSDRVRATLQRPAGGRVSSLKPQTLASLALSMADVSGHILPERFGL